MSAILTWSATVARNGVAQAREESVQALSRADAVAILQRRGFQVMALRMVKPRRPRRRTGLQSSVLRILKGHVTSGTSPESALRQIARTSSDPAIRAALEPALRILEIGGSLGDALAACDFFDPVVLTIIRGGRTARNLPTALEQCISHLHQRRGLRGDALRRLFVVVMEFVSAYSTNLYTGIFGADGPFRPIEKLVKLDARTIDEISRVGAGFNLFDTLMLIVATAGAGYLLATFALMGRFAWWQGRAMRLPFYGHYRRLMATGASLLTWSQMVMGSVHPVDALALLADGDYPLPVKRYYGRVLARLRAGDSLDFALREPDGILEPHEIAEVGARQPREQMAATLKRISDDRSYVAERVYFRMTSTLSILMIAYIGLSMVSMLAYAVMITTHMQEASSLMGQF